MNILFKKEVEEQSQYQADKNASTRKEDYKYYCILMFNECQLNLYTAELLFLRIAWLQLVRGRPLPHLIIAIHPDPGPLSPCPRPGPPGSRGS